jgi:16S rRNA (cytosine967-C5)-methyltransferase
VLVVGKTLQLASRARALNNVIHASDVRPYKLLDLVQRAARTGLKNIHTVTNVELTNYNCILIDAPCSSSGTVRRNPEIKLSSPKKIIEKMNALQLEILNAVGAAKLKPRSKIVYATCSFLKEENEEIVAKFTTKFPQWKCEFQKYLGLSEGVDSDLMFVARMRLEQ